MPEKIVMQPLHLFVPITRKDKTPEGQLIVEGYCYANAVVGDGWNLKRSAMEAASADYMNWANVREMHQPSAVGTADSITWDDKGCFLRATIVDPVAISKCESGVYKGFSVGVSPTVARGKDVETCTWFENSLVDRPADTDAKFNIARAEGITETPAEIEVAVYGADEQLPEPVVPPVQRAAFQDRMNAREDTYRQGLAFDVLSSALASVRNDASNTDPAAAAKEILDEFAAYVIPLVNTKDADIPYEMLYWGAGVQGGRDEALLTRFAEATGESLIARSEKAQAITRAAALEAEITTLRADLEAAKASGSADVAAEITRLTGEKDAEITRAAAELARVAAEKDAEITRLTGEKDAEIARNATEITRLSARVTELEALPDPNQPQPHRFRPSEREFLANRSAGNEDTARAAAAEGIQAEIARITKEASDEKDDGKRQAMAAEVNRLKGMLNG